MAKDAGSREDNISGSTAGAMLRCVQQFGSVCQEGLEVERIRRVPIGSILGLYWGYMGMMKNKMQSIIIGYIGLGFRVFLISNPVGGISRTYAGDSGHRTPSVPHTVAPPENPGFRN